jgi:hypothetical protein
MNLPKTQLSGCFCNQGVSMNVDLVYSCLIDSTWLFLGSWVVLLLTAGLLAFTPPDRGHASDR